MGGKSLSFASPVKIVDTAVRGGRLLLKRQQSREEIEIEINIRRDLRFQLMMVGDH